MIEFSALMSTISTMLMRPEIVSAPRTAALMAALVCVTTSKRRRSARSATAPPKSPGASPFFTCESAWESNPPRRVLRPVNGFEDRGHHRMPRTLMCVCERIRGRVYVEGRGRDQQEAHVTHGRGTSRDKELVKERK